MLLSSPTDVSPVEASEELLLEARRAKDNFLESFKVGIVAVIGGDGIYHESLHFLVMFMFLLVVEIYSG